jgi:1-acyl-sn-glycerol-3-phosphate acyltransferase
MVYHAFRALGVRVTIKGNPPPPASRETGQTGVLFICSHRTLLDPIFLSTALGRPITAVTYSVRSHATSMLASYLGHASRIRESTTTDMINQ